MGPSGRLLRGLIESAGLSDYDVYITNAVKHFKWTSSWRAHQRRLHQRPTGSEVRACRPWLEKELGLVKPMAIVCLGATAVQGVLGKARTLKSLADGEEKAFGATVFATFHPAAALRVPDKTDRRRIERHIRLTLRAAGRLILGGNTSDGRAA